MVLTTLRYRGLGYRSGYPSWAMRLNARYCSSALMQELCWVISWRIVTTGCIIAQLAGCIGKYSRILPRHLRLMAKMDTLHEKPGYHLNLKHWYILLLLC